MLSDDASAYASTQNIVNLPESVERENLERVNKRSLNISKRTS